MILHHSFELSLPPGEAFRLLLDVPRVATCIPGATLEPAANGVYRGAVAVKVGPLDLVFRGDAVLAEANEAARTAVVRGRGTDEKGRGSAQAVMTFALGEVERRTRVDLTTDLVLSGAVAQYGRGQGVIQAVAAQFVAAFVANLEARIAGDAPAAPPPALSAFSLAWAVVKARLGRVWAAITSRGRPGGRPAADAERSPR